MPLAPSLKRPRETHSPSPSSTSSKRAASEDPASASSDSGRPDGLLSPPLTGHGSSPLRPDSSGPAERGPEQAMDMNEDGEWVRRTEEVHIASEGPEEQEGAQRGVGQAGKDHERPARLQEQYSQLLGKSFDRCLTSGADATQHISHPRTRLGGSTTSCPPRSSMR